MITHDGPFRKPVAPSSERGTSVARCRLSVSLSVRQREHEKIVAGARAQALGVKGMKDNGFPEVPVLAATYCWPSTA